MLKLDTTGLFVNDMEKMVLFYRDVMGMKTEWKGEPNADFFSGEKRLIMFGRKDFEEMTSKKYSYPVGMNGTMEIAFEVDNYAEVDKEYERVVKAGAVPVFPPTTEPWGQRTSFVADPEGNLVEIASFTK